MSKSKGKQQQQQQHSPLDSDVDDEVKTMRKIGGGGGGGDESLTENLLVTVTKNESSSSCSKASKFFDAFKRQSKSSSNLNDVNGKNNGAASSFSAKTKSGDISEIKRRTNEKEKEDEAKVLLEQLTPPKSLLDNLDIAETATVVDENNNKEKSSSLEVKVVREKKKINFNDVTFNKTPEKTSLKSSISLSKISTTKRLFDFSYVVLAASFFAYMLASMLATCFGVFFESMESDLGWTRSKVALIGGVISAMQDLTGPIASALTNTYGCRKTAFFGGLIGSAYVETYWLFGFLMGGVSGFGSSLVLVSSVVVVTYYFEEKPSFAAGLTISGGSLGQSIFSMIIIQLNEYYGRSGCFLILGGILLNICVCAALFRPLQWELEDSEDDDSSLEDDDDDDEEDDEEVDEQEKSIDGKSSAVSNEVFSVENELDSVGTKQQIGVPPVASQEITSKYFDSGDFSQQNADVNMLDFTGENLSMQQKELEFIFKVKPMSVKMFSSESCLPVANSMMATNRILSFDVVKLDKVLTQTSIYIKKKRQQKHNHFLNRRKNSLLSNGYSLNRCHSLKNKLDVIPARNQMLREKNNAFFSDPSTLHYSKYLNSASSLMIKQENVDEDDEFKSYLFVNNLYGDEDAHTISNFPTNFYYETGEKHPHSTSLQNLRQNSEPIGLLSMQVSQEFKIDLDENKENTTKQGSEATANLETKVKTVETKQSGILKFFQGKFKFLSTKKEENPVKNKIEQAKKFQQIIAAPVNVVGSSKNTGKANNVVKAPKIYANQPNFNNHSNTNPNPRPTLSQPQKFPTNKQAKLFITKCNCKQRHIQNINRRFLNRKLMASGSGGENLKFSNANKFISNSNKLDKTRHPSLEAPLAAKVNKANPFMQNGTISKNEKFDISKIYNIKGFRHFSNCPLFYLNNLNEDSFIHRSNHHNHHHHHHHHRGHQKPQTSYHYIPNLFQNSYRIPLHYKNVYYYKSLLNLNMGLMALKRNKTLTVKDTNNQDLNSMSFSCPDLEMKQFLVMKANQRQKKSAELGFVHGENLNSSIRSRTEGKKSSKILNAGSIILVNKPEQNLITKNTDGELKKNLKKSKIEKKLNEKGHKTPTVSKHSMNSLSDYTDKIAENESKKTLISKEDETEDAEEEDDDEEDSEEDEDEDATNCLVQTKIGNFLYKFIYKPIFRPMKYVGLSVLENLKLFLIFKFCIFALCNFVLSFFYEAPFYFINSYMIKNSLSQNQAGTIHVGVGVTSVLASILYGYVGDSKKVNQVVLYSVSLILCGLCSCLIPFFIENYLITMILMILIGALISVSDVLVPTICVSIVGYDDFVNAYGMMFFCQGLASLSGPPILGMIVDHLGDYSFAYYLIGIGIAISGFILTTILIFDKCEDNKKISKDENGKDAKPSSGTLQLLM